jgi:nicotinate-nucleotide pyrophosphorylase (carboxylating)
MPIVSRLWWVFNRKRGFMSSGDRIDAVGLDLVRLALREDTAGFGDVTSEWTVAKEAFTRAWLVARQDLVVSGLPLAESVLGEVDRDATFAAVVEDGTAARIGERLAELSGRARSILMAERTMLNMFARICGVATQARRFASAVEGTGAIVVDTRKTTPGLRYWEKRAVRHGGCGNHRFGLFDLVLIKDNHLIAAGGIMEAVRRAKSAAPFGMKVEVEVEDEAGLLEAMAAGADIVMLDNMDVEAMRHAVGTARGVRPEVLLEASGLITFESVRAVAETGVDLISTSALTAGARPVDVALDFVD